MRSDNSVKSSGLKWSSPPAHFWAAQHDCLNSSVVIGWHLNSVPVKSWVDNEHEYGYGGVDIWVIVIVVADFNNYVKFVLKDIW